MIKSLLIVVLITTTLIPAAAQQGSTVSGKVITADLQPAPYVNVILEGTRKGTTTNDNGRFELKNVDAGKHTLNVSFVGLESQNISIEIFAGQPLTVPTIVLAKSSQQLDEVVVEGRNETKYIEIKGSQTLRLGADLIEIPQNITVTTKQAIQDLGILNKSEIGRTTSGVVKSYGEDLDMTFQIRGMNSTYNTYRNGVGGPIWWNAQEDAAMIEKVEFVKGPAGFMLANAEPGGLLNTVTKQPVHQRIAEVNFGTGSYGLMRATIDLGGEFRKDGKVTYRLNTGMQHNSQYYHFGKVSRVFICPVIKYDLNEKTSITFEHNYVEATTQENTHNLMTINEKFFALPSSMAITDPNIGTFMGRDVYTRIAAQHQIDSNWKLSFNAAYMVTDWDGYAMYVDGISPTKDSVYRYSFYSDWSGKLFNSQVFLNGNFSTGLASHDVLVGLDVGDGTDGSKYQGNWGERQHTLSIKNPTYYLPTDSLRAFSNPATNWLATNRWQAIYLQDHLKVWNKVVVTLAGRFTYSTTGQDTNNPPDDPEYETEDFAFTPRLGLTYLITSGISAYGLYDQSFLPQRGAVFNGSRLPPLRGSNREIGIKGLFLDKKLSASAALFDIEKTNVGVSDPEHIGFYMMTGQVRSTGVEVDVTGNISPGLVVIANYSMIDARITDDTDPTLVGLKLVGAPDQVANAWLKYKMQRGKLEGFGVAFGVQHTGRRSGVYPGWGSADGNRFLPDYTLLDAAVSYSSDKFSIGLNVFNLGNVQYAANGNWNPNSSEWYYSPGLPVNFRLQTSLKL